MHLEARTAIIHPFPYRLKFSCRATHPVLRQWKSSIIGATQLSRRRSPLTRRTRHPRGGPGTAGSNYRQFVFSKLPRMDHATRQADRGPRRRARSTRTLSRYFIACNRRGINIPSCKLERRGAVCTQGPAITTRLRRTHRRIVLIGGSVQRRV